MKIVYLDCASGISGDMFLAALVDAGVDLAAIEFAVGSLGIEGLRLVRREVKRHAFRATQIVVEHPPEHAHRHLHHIAAMIERGELTPRQKELALRIFALLAEAEAKVHGTTVEKVHFHEVGAADSIADIVGAAVGWDLLGAGRAFASPIPTGSGTIEIAHGRCSVPAPAVGELLRGVPLAASSVEAELTTPTGAAILRALVESHGPMPAMTVERIGYGAGSRDLTEQANVLRLLVGEESETASQEPADFSSPIPQSAIRDPQSIWLVETNLDDAPGEWIGYAIERLWEAGALDVWTSAIHMKKNRPGVRLSALAAWEKIAAIEAILLGETTTLGVRRWPVERTTLPRRPHRVKTPLGEIEGVLAETPGGTRFSPAYESCRTIAMAIGLPLRDVYAAAEKAFREG